VGFGTNCVNWELPAIIAIRLFPKLYFGAIVRRLRGYWAFSAKSGRKYLIVVQHEGGSEIHAIVIENREGLVKRWRGGVINLAIASALLGLKIYHNDWTFSLPHLFEGECIGGVMDVPLGTGVCLCLLHAVL
jgi:hypothetical protein